MLEYWNNDLKKMIFLYLIPVKRNFTITQLSIFSLSHRLSEPEAQNPIFQHSNCERSELTWIFVTSIKTAEKKQK
ncbi:MAG: hypothetical protein DRH24_19975 [Deltaproteobacteria bacterium]|nr:MAG: hypothetical protein DRH24_19975 [Deltaproteobacteria bacterium]